MIPHDLSGLAFPAEVAPPPSDLPGVLELLAVPAVPRVGDVVRADTDAGVVEPLDLQGECTRRLRDAAPGQTGKTREGRLERRSVGGGREGSEFEGGGRKS